jgi:hypothetical protein
MDEMDEMDDFEIEVTDLETGATTRHPLTEGSESSTGDVGAAAADDQSDYGADDRSAVEELDDPDTLSISSPRRSRHVTRIRAAIVSGVVLLAVVLVFVFNPTAQSSLYTVFGFPTPIPTPTPLPGGDIVYLERGAPWGIAALDGKVAPFATLGSVISWIRLTRGRHTITVTEPPFPALSCTISYPASRKDTCPLIPPPSLDNGEVLPNGTGVSPEMRFIDLGARFSLLPRDAQDALVAAVNAYMTSAPAAPLTLKPGDHYLRDDGTMALAQTTLAATFIPTLLTPIAGVRSDNPSCVSFCDLSGITYGTSSWDIQVSLVGSWRVTTADGQVLTQQSPMAVADPIYQDIPPVARLGVSPLWQNGWVIDPANIDHGALPVVCQTATDMIYAILVSSSGAGIGSLPGATAESGCLLVLTPDGVSQSNPLYVLYHLGVLLAVNDATHRAYPALPVATANERALAQRILAGQA